MPPLHAPVRPLTRAARRGLAAAGLLAALAALAPPPAAAQTPPERLFAIAIVGFDDVNGNGLLDCGEPVTVQVGYFDAPEDLTPAFTGHLTALFSGTAGLSFLPGTVLQDDTFTTGRCQGVITSGNDPSDAEADFDFTCNPPQPNQGNAIAWTFKALFTGTAPPLVAVARGITSDGFDETPSATQSPLGTLCTGAPASATVGKTVAGTGAPGSTLLYTLRVTDTSGLGLGGVQLTDVVPANTTFDAAASNPAWSCPAKTAGTQCTLPLGNVLPNGTASAFFAVDVAAPLPAGIASIANTGCARQGPSLVLGCASANLPTTGAAALKLGKSLLSGTPTPGATLVYQLALSNTGNQDSGPVTLAETVPANTQWAAAASAAGWTCASANPGAACTLPVANVPAGGAVTTQFAVTLADPLPAGVTAVTNTACLAGTSTCGTLSTPTDGTTALSLRKTLAGTAVPGNTLTYTLAVQATGNEGAAGVVVTEPVPALTTFLPAASSPGWTCAPGAAAGATCTANLGTLAPGATATLTFAVQVASPLPAGATAVANTACAAFGAPTLQAAPACDTVSTPTQGHPQLLLAKQYQGGPAAPGAVLAFTLALRNTGNQDAGAVTLQETVPVHSTFDAAASSPGWTCAAPTAGAACTLAVPALAAGASTQAVFAVTAAAALPPNAVIDNAACAVIAGGSGGAGGTTACASAATPAALSLATTLAVSPRTVTVQGGVAQPGDLLQYTLTVPNTQAAALAGLVSTLTLDPHESLVTGSVTTDHGTVTTGNAPGDATVVVTLGTLAPGQVATVTFTCKLASGLPAGTTTVAAQAETAGTNVPADASDDPATPQPDDPTAVAVTVTAATPAPIPTLGGWGLFLLSLGLAAAGVVVDRRRRRAAGSDPDGGADAGATSTHPTPRPFVR